MTASALPDAAASTSILAPAHRATTIGMVALVSLNAFEALAVATAMPTAAAALDGLRLYAMAFGALLAASVVGMAAAGRWSDHHGPAQPLWAGLGCFVAGLLLAGAAPGMTVLIGGRLLQGLGSGALSVALYVLVGRLYPAALRPRVFAAFSAGWVVPSLIGPALSGWIVVHLGWRWVFLAVPLIAVPAASLLYRPLAALPPRRADGDADPAAALHWAVAAAACVLALYLGGQQHGALAAAIGAPAALMLVLCCRRLLPPGTLLARRGLPSMVLLRALAPAAFFGCEAFIPLLLARERGLSPLLAGIVLSAGALGWFAGSWYQGHGRHGRHGWSRLRLLRVGTMLLAGGIAVVALAVLPAVPVPLAAAGWIVAGLGMGLVYPSLSLLVLQLSPPQRQGANSSALQLSEAIAVAGMLALGGSLFAALLERAVALAYLLNFGLALLLALAACALAPRVLPR